MQREEKNEVYQTVKESIDRAERDRRRLRFQHNFLEMQSGKLQVLKSDEFLTDFLYFLKRGDDSNRAEVTSAIRSLKNAVVFDDIAIRERALAVLSQYSQFVHNTNDQFGMLNVMDCFYEWLLFENEVLAGSVVLCRRIEEIMEWLVWKGLIEDAERIFTAMAQIHDGKLEKSTAIRGMVGKSIDSLKKKAILETLTNGYLAENAQRVYYKKVLILMGPRAIAYALNRIIDSHNRKERLDLIELIKLYGDSGVPVLVNHLKADPPWSVVRNIIYILTEIGDLEIFSELELYCRYPDERVQLEVLRFITRFEGEAKNTHLINALGLVGERLKIHVLRLLIDQEFKNEDTFAAIRDLANQRGSFSASIGVELLSAIITSLKCFPCDESVQILREMREDYGKSAAGGQVVLLIEEALNIIEPKIRHSSRDKSAFDDMVSFDSDPLQKQMAASVMQTIETEVQKHLEAGEQKEAGALLYDQAVTYLNQKDYTVAEMLRNRILEVNPLALSEVIQLGELIEEHKSNSITSHHIEIWNDLYEEMTSEEFSTLYYALREETYNKGDIIVKSGETDSNLYFVNSGYVSLSCMAGGNEIFLKRMQPSDILGAEQFFSPSIWTVTLKALSVAQLHILDQEKWKEVLEAEPGIEDKLQKYCAKYRDIPKLLQMSGDDRREYPRHAARLITRNLLLDPYGKKGKRTFNGELIDISRAGLAFTIRIAKKENSRMLLGRQIITTISVDGKDFPPCTGVIVGVRVHDPLMFDFSVHVKLSKKIDDIMVKKIVSSSTS